MAAQEFTNAEIQMFRDLPINNAFLEEKMDTILPTHHDVNSGLIEFHLPITDYFILNKIGLKSTLGIMKVDAATGVESRITDATDKIASLPLIGLMAYRQCELSINGTTVEGAGSNFGYKAWIKTIGGHEQNSLENNKTMAFFHPDEIIGSNRALTEAWKFRKSKYIGQDPVLFSLLPFDCLSSTKLFPARTEIVIKLYHARDEFRLQASPDAAAFPYRLNVYGAELKIWLYMLNPDKLREFYRCYSIEHPLTMTYPTFEVLGPYPLHKDTAIFSQRIRFDRRPVSLYVWFANATASAGSFVTNPLFFQHLDTIYCQCEFGSQHEPIEGYKTHFNPAENQGRLDLTDCYNALRKSLGAYQNSKSTFLDLEHFVNGYKLFTFKFSPLYYSTQYRPNEIDTKADLSVTFNFRKAITTQMNMFCMVNEYKSLIIRPNSTASVVIPGETL